MKFIFKHKVLTVLAVLVLISAFAFIYAYYKSNNNPIIFKKYNISAKGPANTEKVPEQTFKSPKIIATGPIIPKEDTSKNINKTTSAKSSTSAVKEMKGVYNILLIGVDTRATTFRGNTDTIIILSFNKDKHVMKITSLMRDMYVDIPGHRSNRINAAYELGGPELLFKTIKNNFDFSINKYAIINFRSFQKVVNDLGGININVKKNEIALLNHNQKEINKHFTPVTKPGLQLLDGAQALGYSRIRNVGNNDFERTERQRNVIIALINKSKTMSFLTIPKLIYDLHPYVKTNVPVNDLVSLAYTVYKDRNFKIDTYRLPGNNMYKNKTIRGMDVLVPNLAKCRQGLNDFLTKGIKY